MGVTLGLFDTLPHFLGANEEVKLVLQILQRIPALTVHCNSLTFDIVLLIAQEVKDVFVKGQLLLLVLIKPFHDVDLVYFEADDLHENDLIDLGAVLVMEAEELLAEPDLVLESLNDRPADDERQQVLGRPCEQFLVGVSHSVEMVLELVSPVLNEANSSGLPKLFVFVHHLVQFSPIVLHL